MSVVDSRRIVLHVGCGHAGKEDLPPLDFGTKWREVRLDIDPAVAPDIVDDIVHMAKVADASVDLVFSKHNLEHLERHQVPLCLANVHRVLKPGGALILRTPDFQAVAEAILAQGPETTIYTATVAGRARPVCALDMLFGAGWEIAAGNRFMAHRTAFTKDSLEAKLRAAGFAKVGVSRDAKLRELKAMAAKEG